MQILRSILFLSLLAMAPRPALAESARGFYAGVGALSANILKTAANGSGARSLLGDIYFPELSFGYRFRDWFPTFSYSLLGKTYAENTKSRGTFRLQVPYVFSGPETPWEAKAGLGLLVHRIYGDGGATELANGGGRQTYYVPEDGSNARIFYLTGGVGLKSGHLRYDLDLLLSGVLSARRAFHLTAGAGYVF